MVLFINSKHQSTLHVLFHLHYLTHVMQVKCLCFLIPQDAVISVEKGVCVSEDIFMGSREGLEDYTPSQMPRLVMCMILK